MASEKLSGTGKKIVVITGATGKLGRVVVPLFVKSGFRVRAVVRDSCKAQKLFSTELKSGKLELFEAELQDASAVNVLKLSRACEGGVAVVHLAALVDATASRKDLHAANVVGTKVMVEAAKRARVEKFVLCSSTAVYGTPRDAPASEATVFKPFYAYGESKLQAEQEVRKSGLPFVILRPGVIYGPSMASQFSAMLEAIAAGKAKIFGKGDNYLPFVHERDVAKAFLLAVQKRGVAGDFIIVDDARVTQKQALQIVAKALGARPPEKHFNAAIAKLLARIHVLASKMRGRRPSFTPELIELTAAHRHFSVEKARKLLGWQPKEKIEKALGEMVAEWKKNRGGK